MAPHYALLLTILLIATPAVAEEVSLGFPQGRVGLADYRASPEGADGERGALLLVHGFLQTHHFGLIGSIADELADNGWTTLAPTLTLGIDHRRQSLPCDALQLHSLEAGSEEIGHWVDWLRQRGHRRIGLVGHSSGGLRALHFASGEGGNAVEGMVLLSMIHLANWENPGQGANELARARHMQQMGRVDLAPYSVSYCSGNYMAPPGPFLSYAGFDESRVVGALSRINQRVRLIYGLADRRLPAGWIERIGSVAPLHTIDGADHFFSGMHEFDLHSNLLDALDLLIPAAEERP